MKAKKKIWIPIAVLVLLGIAAAIAVPRILEAVNRDAPKMEEPVNVTVDAPGVGEITRQTQLTGTVEPGEMVYVLPKMSGEVTATYAKVGDTVKAGQLLCQLSDESVQPQIDQAQASVALAQTNVTMANGGATQQQIDQLEASLTSAKLSMQEAERGLQRTQELFDAGAASQQNLEQAQKGYDLAKLQLESAQKAYDLTTGQVIGENLAAAKAQLKQAQVGLDSARQQLSYTKITAPISGVIEQKNVKEHDMASPQNAVYVISSRDQMTVNFSVSEDSMKHMKPGDALTVEKGGKTYAGSVLEVSSMVDAQTGLFLVKGTVETSEELYTGSTVKVTATTQRVENVMLVPLDVVYYQAGKPYVYVLEQGVAKRVFVETGLFDEESIEITAGLTAQSALITSWSSQLKDGSPVYLVDTDAAEGEAS